MSQCPCCGAHDCVSKRFDNVPFEQVAGAALGAKQAGRPAHAVSALAVWACVEVVNYLRDGWTCRVCGFEFS